VNGKSKMATGTIKRYDPDRGFGFIVPDAGGIDIFVHIKNCSEDIEELKQGQRVRFDERQSPRHAGKFEAYAVALV
jgi:CspA family cold shock protein